MSANSQTPQGGPWRIENSTAHLSGTAFRAQLDLSRPQSGLADLELDGRPLAAHLFELPLSANPGALETPLDVYSRDEDLVATYPETGGRAFRTQVYWRYLAAEAMQPATTELVVSVQTSLLDSQPTLTVVSRLPAGEVLRLTTTRPAYQSAELLPGQSVELASSDAPTCLLVRLADGKQSYAQMLPPGDCSQTRIAVASDGQVEIQHELFAGRLEKGVILRARVRGAFLQQAHDEQEALQAYQALLSARLPLTT